MIKKILFLAVMFLFIPNVAFADAGSSGNTSTIMLWIGIAVIIYLIYMNLSGSKNFTVDMSRDKVTGLMISYLNRKKYLVQSQREGSKSEIITFAKRKRPSIILGLFLCLFWVLPGIIYFIIGGRTETIIVTLSGTNKTKIEAEGIRKVITDLQRALT